MSIEEKRREKFEAWYAKQFNIETGRALDPAELERLRGEEGNYRGHPSLRGKWEGWNAALDSVVIDMPSFREVRMGRPQEVTQYDSGVNHGIEICTDAIEACGLKVKV